MLINRRRFYNPGFFFLACVLLSTTLFPASVEGQTKFPVLTDAALPESLSLCGEPIPLQDRNVREMLDREFTISVWDHAQVFMWLKRSSRYFPFIEQQLAKAGLPDDLKYLAVAESALLPHVRSRAGALGLWQFMPQTGTRHGLKKGYGIDERLNPELSTAAALLYLKDLYARFGKWSLALAAYNCGEYCIEKALKEQKVSDYFRLNLPLETERFVFRIAAIKIILQDPTRYGYHVPQSHMYTPIPGDTRAVKLTHSLDIVDLAQELGTDYKEIKELNPHIVGKHLPSGQFALKVPEGMGDDLLRAIKKLSLKKKAKRSSGSYYVVKPGDTLSSVSRKTGVSVKTLKRLNRIRGDLIKVGERLRIR